MSRIRMTIDSIILKGFDEADGRGLIDGLRSELAGILSDPAMRAGLTRSNRAPVLKLGRIPLEAGSTATREFGAGVARAIGKGLRR